MEKEDLRKTADELFIEAFVTGVPNIIVEGNDDITFYNRICKAISKEALVMAIELIHGYSEGCGDVIRVVEYLQSKIGIDRCKPYILGIIDKDVRELFDKKCALDEFAAQSNITYCEECVKKIVKGKWLLHAYCQYILCSIRKLPELCSENKIRQCCYCSVGKSHKCEYRTRTNLQENALIARLENATIQLDEILYIKERIIQLA